ncbi:hypothetical protein [Thermus albus]|uniref:hypothetical protein n=1 Tax=Thermus albus TaxID=2908146 RepID=UPI001FAA19B8|nr:hypothetical protein [Thermus albus]
MAGVSAIVEGLLDLLRWLAQTAIGFFGWLWQTVTGFAHWVWSVLDWVFVHAWNLFIDVLGWALGFVFEFVGSLLVLVLKFVLLLVSLLPDVPNELLRGVSAIVPAAGIADRILPISDAITIVSLWGSFYGVMAIWRVITFIRGGR